MEYPASFLSLGAQDGGPFLSVRPSDGCPPFPLGAGLLLHCLFDPGDGVHFPYLHGLDPHPPGVRCLVQYIPEMAVYPVPVVEYLVQLHVADDASEGGLGEIYGGPLVVVHLVVGLPWVYDFYVDDGVHPCGGVVLGYDLLGRDIQGHGSQVYFDNP